jgi:hypothetical protein
VLFQSDLPNHAFTANWAVSFRPVVP